MAALTAPWFAAGCARGVTIDLAAYFARVNYHAAPDPTLDTLRALHRAHLLAIPFENLDIHLKRPIVLDERALFDKIVTRRRGGFCYEQNGLFAAVLRALGFDVTLLEARVRTAQGTFGIPFDHLVLMVRLGGRWLVDVGFGESFREPLRLDLPGPQACDGQVYQVRHNAMHGVYAHRTASGRWRAEYCFSFQPRRLSDFESGCHYHQTSPDSPFTQKRVCSLATPDGRITLRDRQLIVTRTGQRRDYALAGEAQFWAALRDHFGITLAPPRSAPPAPGSDDDFGKED